MSHSARARFCALFDAGAYWEAHEALEALWRETGSSLHQALVQVAAAFVHVERRRYGAASRVLARAREKLARLPAREDGVDVEGLRAHLAAIAEHLELLVAGEAENFDARLCFSMSAHVEAGPGEGPAPLGR